MQNVPSEVRKDSGKVTVTGKLYIGRRLQLLSRLVPLRRGQICIGKNECVL